MLSGPHRKFAEGIVRGLNSTQAYRAAYPKTTADAARKNAPRLMANDGIKAEIDRLRAKADEKAGSAVLTLAEKRSFLARLLRAQPALLERESDLWQSIKQTENGTEYRLPDKLGAIKQDNDLAGQGSEAGANDAIGEILRELRQ